MFCLYLQAFNSFLLQCKDIHRGKRPSGDPELTLGMNMSVNSLFVSICPLRHKANGLKSSYRLVNALPGLEGHHGWCMGDYDCWQQVIPS